MTANRKTARHDGRWNSTETATTVSVDNNASYKVLDASIPSDWAEWLKIWESWPRREVFAHPGYQEVFSATSGRQVRCALLKTENGRVMFPFFLQGLEEQPCWTPSMGACCDISTHGYAGPFYCDTTDHRALAERFWQCFDAWTSENGVVSEFVRMSMFSDLILDYPGKKESKVNIVRSLDLDESELWMEVRHKVRKNVKRARSVGLRVEVDTEGRRLSDFFQVYSSTMERRNVSAQESYEQSFFEGLCEKLAGQFVFLHAMHEGLVVASEMVLFGSENAYSFLGGTDSRYFESRPNDLLKYEAILWAQQSGLKHFVLGGGRDANDGVFRYKQSFAPKGEMSYPLGWRILRQDLYDQLVARSPGAGQTHYSPSCSSTYFPAYRRAA